MPKYRSQSEKPRDYTPRQVRQKLTENRDEFATSIFLEK
jgi:hypothetical protein